MSDDEENGDCKTDTSGSSTAGKNEIRTKNFRIFYISKMNPIMVMKSMRLKLE